MFIAPAILKEENKYAALC